MEKYLLIFLLSRSLEPGQLRAMRDGFKLMFMVHEYGEELWLRLNDELQLIDESKSPMVVFRAQNKLLSAALRELEGYRLEHPLMGYRLRFSIISSCCRGFVRCNFITVM